MRELLPASLPLKYAGASLPLKYTGNTGTTTYRDWHTTSQNLGEVRPRRPPLCTALAGQRRRTTPSRAARALGFVHRQPKILGAGMPILVRSCLVLPAYFSGS